MQLLKRQVAKRRAMRHVVFMATRSESKTGVSSLREKILFYHLGIPDIADDDCFDASENLGQAS